MLWVEQTREYADCKLIASANAARFHGLNPHPTPQSDPRAWHDLVVECGGEHGSVIREDIGLARFGLRAHSLGVNWDVGDLCPGDIVATSDPAAGLHAVFLAAIKGDGWRDGHLGLVGHQWLPFIVWVSPSALEEMLMPKGNINRRADRTFRKDNDGQSVGEEAPSGTEG